MPAVGGLESLLQPLPYRPGVITRADWNLASSMVSVGDLTLVDLWQLPPSLAINFNQVRKFVNGGRKSRRQCRDGTITLTSFTSLDATTRPASWVMVDTNKLPASPSSSEEQIPVVEPVLVEKSSPIGVNNDEDTSSQTAENREDSSVQPQDSEASTDVENGTPSDHDLENVASLPLHDPENVESLPLPRLQSVESTSFPRAANSLDSDPHLNEEDRERPLLPEDVAIPDPFITEDAPSRLPFIGHTEEHGGSSPILSSQRIKSFELVKPDIVESSPLPANRMQTGFDPCLESVEDSYPPTPDGNSFPPTPHGSSTMLTAEEPIEAVIVLAEGTLSNNDVTPLESALFGLASSRDGTPSFTQSTSNIEPARTFTPPVGQTSDPVQVLLPASPRDSFVTCDEATSIDSISLSNPASSEDSLASCGEAPTLDSIPPPKKCRWLEQEDLTLHPTLQNVIGEGSFSTVHIMCHGNKNVVVKIFKNDAPLDLEAVLTEADTAAYMGAYGIGPTVIGLIKPTRNHRLPALVMEHLPGAQDMFNFISTHRKVTRSDMLDMLMQAARLIGVVHDRGFIHNDVKITNFLIVANPLHQGLPEHRPMPPGSVSGSITSSSRYRLYLIDFGQTTFNHGATFDMDEQTLSSFKQFPYLPPEVVAGEPTARTTDVFSFGMSMSMVAEMLGVQSLTDDLAPLIIRCCHTDPLCRPSIVELEQALAGMRTSPHTSRVAARRIAVARRRMSLSGSRSTSSEESTSTGPEDFSITCIKKFTNTLSDPSSTSSADTFPVNRKVVTFGKVVSDWKQKMANGSHSDVSSDTSYGISTTASEVIHSTPDIESSDDTSTSFEIIPETSGEASTSTGDSGVHFSFHSDIDLPNDAIHPSGNVEKEAEDKDGDDDNDAFCVDEDLFVGGFVSEQSSIDQTRSQSMLGSREISPSAAANAVQLSLLAAACGQIAGISIPRPSRSPTEIEPITSVNSSPIASTSTDIAPTSTRRPGTFTVYDQSKMFKLAVKDDEEDDDDDDVFVSWPYIFTRSTVTLPTQCTWRWLEKEHMLPDSLDPKDALSDGTFAWVHRMWYKNRDVIVKVCKPNGQSDVEMMVREADMATLLGTYGVGPAITGVLHRGPGSDLPAIVMEYLPGAQDVLNLIEQRVIISRIDLLDVFMQAARLLSFIHQRHFIHNDVKLTNILVVPNDGHEFAYASPEGATGGVTFHCKYRVYLIDFGQTTFERGAIYQLAEQDMEEFEQYPYLPPEVVGGEPTAPTSDVYAFGMAMDLAMNVLNGESLSEELQSLISQCTHVDKTRRPTMEEVECSLQRRIQSHVAMPDLPISDSDISDSDDSDDMDDADDEDGDDDGDDQVAPPIDYGLQAGEGAGELHEPQLGPMAIGSSGEGGAAFEGVLPAGIQRVHPSFEDIWSLSDSGEDISRGFAETYLRRASRNILQLQCSPLGVRVTSSSYTLQPVLQSLSPRSTDSDSEYNTCFEEEVD